MSGWTGLTGGKQQTQFRDLLEGNWATWQNSAGLGRGANWAASVESRLSGPGFSFPEAHPSHLVSLLTSQYANNY